MTQSLFCIKHEEMVLAEGACCIGHEKIVTDTDGLPELRFCDFPDGWATMPPPEAELDWIEHAVEAPLDEHEFNGWNDDPGLW